MNHIAKDKGTGLPAVKKRSKTKKHREVVWNDCNVSLFAGFRSMFYCVCIAGQMCMYKHKDELLFPSFFMFTSACTLAT